MKRAILAVGAVLSFVCPASAQMRYYSTAPRNPVIIRTPPSSAMGAAGVSAPTTSSNKSMYPSPIKKQYDPLWRDPTVRNQNLRKY